MRLRPFLASLLALLSLWLLAPNAALAQVYQINCGGGASAPFSADADFSGGNTYSAATAIDTSAVTNPAPQAVYQSQRWGTFSYTLPGLTAGAPYLVRLHFSEPNAYAPGTRVFRVTINGQVVLPSFDVIAAAGARNKAVIEQFVVNATTGGAVVAQFAHVSGTDPNAMVSGIEVLPSNFVYDVNCGGAAASPYSADAFFSGGSTFSTASAVSTAGVPAPAPQAVYQTERNGAFTYTFPHLTPNTGYSVRLHFAELYFGSPGQRRFNVGINGVPVLANFDVIATAGAKNKAVVEQFGATSDAGGNIAVQFTAGTANVAKCDGIQILTAPAPVADVPAPGWAQGAEPADASDAGGAGPSSSVGVSLPSGAEENAPGPDLDAFNPVGPGVSYERTYRASRAAHGYASPGLSPGWTDDYDLSVAPGGGTYTLTYPDGAQETWAGTTGALTPPAGVPYLANNPSAGVLTMTFPDRSVYTFTQETASSANYPVNTYLLTRITNLLGHAVTLNRDTAANNYRLKTITNDATPTPATLLAFAYDGLGHLQSVQDTASADRRQVLYTFGAASDPNVTNKSLLKSVSQIALTTNNSPAPQWQYDYQAVGGAPYVSSVVSANPAGAGLSGAALTHYDYLGRVASHQDAGGALRAYYYGAASGTGVPGVQVDTYNPSSLGGGLALTEQRNYNPLRNVDAGFTDAAGDSATISYTTPPAGPFVPSPSPYLPSVVTDRNGQSVGLTYDTSGGNASNVATVTSPRGTTAAYQYDYTATGFPLGQLKSAQVSNVTNGTTTTMAPTTFDYFPNGLLKDVYGPAPETVNNNSSATVHTAYTYTALGNVATETLTSSSGMVNNAAATVQVVYNYLTYSYTDGAGMPRTYSQSEALGEPVSVTVTGYDAGNNKLDSTVSYAEYDSRGRRTASIDALGNREDFAYGTDDQVQGVLYPASDPTKPTLRASLKYLYQYVGGPVTSVTLYPEGSATPFRQVNYAYGPEGELLQTTDLNKNVLEAYAYDGLYRVNKVTDGGGHSTLYDYDALGDLGAIRYPIHQQQQPLSPYDALQFFYDKDSNLVERIDGNGVETDYVRDSTDSRLMQVHYPAGTAPDTFYGYDAFERLNAVNNGAATKSYAFDDLDDVLSATTSFVGGPQGQALTYHYYPDGSRKQMVTPAGSYGYQYDAIRRLTQAMFPWQGGYVSHTYLQNGWLKRTQGPLTQTVYTYNGRGFLLNLMNTSHTNRTLLSNYVGMTYDAAGNRLTETTQVPALGMAPDASRVLGYSYDVRDELLTENSVPDLFTYNGTDPYAAHYAWQFGYDLAFNPTEFRGGGSANASYNIDNQFTLSGLSYDGNGNPNRVGGGAAATFDAENRLTALSSPAFAAAYDGDGLRVRKTAAGVTSYYLDDGGAPVVEETYDGTKATVVAANGLGADGWRQRFYPGADPYGPAGNTYGGQSYAYLYDPQGSLVQRQASGNFSSDALDNAVYDGFGALTADRDTGTGAAEGYADPVGFGGQFGYYTDPETKGAGGTGSGALSLLTNRYYDGGRGRFLTRDPIGYKGGVNLYGYTGNNPVNRKDPSGLQETPAPEGNPFISEDAADAIEIAKEIGEENREREAAGRRLQAFVLEHGYFWSLRGEPPPIFDLIVDEADAVAVPGYRIMDFQRELLRRNLPQVQRRNVQQNQAMRADFEKNQRYIIQQWERAYMRSWPRGATPHHIIPLESGGSNKWWNMVPTRGTLPNHSLPGIRGPHAAGGMLRRTIQRGPRALPPGTVTDLRRPM